MLQQFQAIHLGHLQIQKYHDRMPRHAALKITAPMQVIQRLPAMSGHHHWIGNLVLFQGGDGQFNIVKALSSTSKIGLIAVMFLLF